METYRNPVHKRGSGDRQQSEEKMYRNPVRREDLGIGSDRKKVVPESGTSGRIREQVAIGRKLYRNPVRQVGSGNGQRSEESCTGIRYVR